MGSIELSDRESSEEAINKINIYAPGKSSLLEGAQEVSVGHMGEFGGYNVTTAAVRFDYRVQCF